MRAAAPTLVRATLFADHPAPPTPRPGPLSGFRALVIVAPTRCDGEGVTRLSKRLRALGMWVAVASECHGEARDEHRHPVATHLLLVEARPTDYDAFVLAGGAGAARVAEDAYARTLVAEAVAAGRVIAALGQGALVLARAGAPGLVHDDPDQLAIQIAERFRPFEPSFKTSNSC
jgi:hypothetical protein